MSARKRVCGFDAHAPRGANLYPYKRAPSFPPSPKPLGDHLEIVLGGV